MRHAWIESTVGVFMLMAIGALLVLAVKVSGLSDITAGVQGYEVVAEFSNVGGLKPRSRVSIAGVPIGRVQSITLNAETYTAEVSVLIDADMNNIPDDSEWKILTAGLLGDNYISLEPGFSEDMLSDGDRIALAQTGSAVILEELISKFLASQAK